MSKLEDRFFAAVADRQLVRPCVRAIIVKDGSVLVQRPADSAAETSYAFIGGEYELGDTFESRLRVEIDEETNARLVGWRYLFVAENLFVSEGHRVHGLEHYLEASIDRVDVSSREPHLTHEWLPLGDLANADLRPHVVRDVLATGRHRHVKHLIVNGWR
ncbi:MAG TPA: NUDIX domain-containing protein [Rugosimonospora sp.]